MRTFLLPRRPDSRGRLVLRGEDHHYLTRVLRLAEDDQFPGTDGAGGTYRCTILSITREHLELQVEAAAQSADATASEHRREGAAHAGQAEDTAQPEIHLYQALLKGKKMDAVVRQATEAGVAALIPVETARAVPFFEADREEKKRRRWEKIAAEAVQQSGRTTLPDIPAPISVEEVPAHWNGRGTALLFHQDPLENSPLHRYLSVWPESVALCIGPEGGFSPEEVETLTAGGFAPVRFRSPVLRAETAAVFALGAVHTILTERTSWNPTLR
jgi:16S rRNA (uracil1498-N3)-methyltransferase